MFVCGGGCLGCSGPSLPPLPTHPGPLPRWRPLRNCRVSEHRKIEVVVKVFVGGCLPYPSRLSAPVTLTLSLSRRAGEGICPIASPVFAMVSRRGEGDSPSHPPFCPPSARPPLGSRFRGNDGGGGLRVRLVVVYRAPPVCPPREPPLSFGHFPRERGKPWCFAMVSPSGRGDSSLAG